MGIKVLSLFDGISCGMVALERAGIKVDRYVAYEIDKNAIKISQHNYPNIEHMGDVTTADFTQYKDFDLLIGGSPCQDLSSCKQKKDGLGGKKSSLFFTYLKAKNIINPRFFLLENVVPKTSDKNIITGHMGVEPVFINSADFCAQTRQRLYWTNINVNIKADKSKDTIKDILECTATWTDKKPKWLNGKWGGKTRFDMLKSTNQKAHCLLASMGKGKICSYVKNKDLIHKLTPLECERLQTLDDNYTNCVADTHRYNCIGNGWTVDVIAHIFKNMEV